MSNEEDGAAIQKQGGWPLGGPRFSTWQPSRPECLPFANPHDPEQFIRHGDTHVRQAELDALSLRTAELG